MANIWTIFGFLESCLWQKGLGVSHPTWTKNDQPSIHWLNQKTHVRLSDSRMDTVSRNGYKAITSRIIAFYYQDTDKTDCFLSSNFLYACMYKVNKMTFYFFYFFQLTPFPVFICRSLIFGASKEKRRFQRVSNFLLLPWSAILHAAVSVPCKCTKWFCLSYLSCFVPSLV